eukprot:Lankesteria_metandrocarpae@DN3992_c0_g1_i1.p1
MPDVHRKSTLFLFVVAGLCTSILPGFTYFWFNFDLFVLFVSTPVFVTVACIVSSWIASRRSVQAQLWVFWNVLLVVQMWSVFLFVAMTLLWQSKCTTMIDTKRDVVGATFAELCYGGLGDSILATLCLAEALAIHLALPAALRLTGVSSDWALSSTRPEASKGRASLSCVVSLTREYLQDPFCPFWTGVFGCWVAAAFTILDWQTHLKLYPVPLVLGAGVGGMIGSLGVVFSCFPHEHSD